MYRLFIFCLLLPLIKGLCFNGSVEWQTNCLLFNSTKLGFARAEFACTAIGGHLASIHDAFSNAIINEYAPDYFHESTESDFWIGSNTLITRGNWSWTDGSAFDFNDWKKGEPQDSSEAACTAISINDGFWSAQECCKTKPFVCAISNFVTKPTVPTTITPKISSTSPVFANCSSGWIYFEPTGYCYGGDFGNTEYDWNSAETYCQNEGGHLPSVHSYEELEFLGTYVAIGWEALWLGLYSVDSGNTFHYTDNSPVDYIPWRSGEPAKINGQSCVVLGVSQNFDFVNRACNQTWHKMCKKPYIKIT